MSAETADVKIRWEHKGREIIVRGIAHIDDIDLNWKNGTLFGSIKSFVIAKELSKNLEELL